MSGETEASLGEPTMDGETIDVADRDVTDLQFDRVNENSFSLEVGHLYFQELLDDPEAAVTRLLRGVSPWLEAFRLVEERQHRERVEEHGASAGPPPRFSTCLLVDDYFLPERVDLPSYVELLDAIISAAAQVGFAIDYVMREAACVEGSYRFADGHSGAVQSVSWRPADVLLDRLRHIPGVGQAAFRPEFLSPDGQDNPANAPDPGTNWFSNGRRTVVARGLVEAGHSTSDEWLSPEEYGARNHSVFLDIEVYNQFPRRDSRRNTEWRYSCASLAAVWQALRLGELRWSGRLPVAQMYGEEIRALNPSWSEAPALVVLGGRRTQEFAAEQTVNFLHPRFLSTEHAVSALLNAFDRFQKSGDGGTPADASPLADKVIYLFDKRVSADLS